MVLFEHFGDKWDVGVVAKVLLGGCGATIVPVVLVLAFNDDLSLKERDDNSATNDAENKAAAQEEEKEAPAAAAVVGPQQQQRQVVDVVDDGCGGGGGNDVDDDAKATAAATATFVTHGGALGDRRAEATLKSASDRHA